MKVTYLGGTVGTLNFKNIYVKEKVNEWISELQLLSKIAVLEPQANYFVYTAGFNHKITFFTRTITSVSQHLKQFDDYNYGSRYSRMGQVKFVEKSL